MPLMEEEVMVVSLCFGQVHLSHWKLRYHAGRDPSLIVFTDSSYAPEVMVVPLCFGQEHLSLGGVRGRPLLRPPVLKRSYWQQVKGRHSWPR